ncbi:MAG: glycosyltransferase family 39 protein [Dehalococcoidia bacterium]|nr:glycosyltransferase family 39 protein [Dehalococcoidia bacterium]
MALTISTQRAAERAAAAFETLRNLHRTHPGLFAILVFTVVTRIAIYVVGEPWNDDVINNTILDGDGLQYHAIATGFLNGTPLSETNWATDRTLGYPYFVTAIYAISNNSIWLVLAVQTVLNILMIPIIFWVARTLFDSQRAGTIAAGLFAFSAIAAAWATRFLFTETLFTFVFVIFIAVFIHAWRRESFRWFLLMGVLLGLGSIVRSLLQYFVVIPVIIILLQNRTVRNKTAVAGALVIGLVAVIAPFQLRNLNAYGHYSLSTISGNVLTASIVRSKARADGTGFYEARDELGWQEYADDENPFDRSAEGKSRAISYVLNNPTSFVVLYVQGMVSFLIGTEKSSYLYVIFNQDPPELGTPLNYETFTDRIVRNLRDIQKEYFLTPLLVIKLLFEYLFIGFGLVLLIRNKQSLPVLFLLLAILYFIIATGLLGRAPRYKIPVLPIYAIIGGGGAMLVWAYLQSWKEPENRPRILRRRS